MDFSCIGIVGTGSLGASLAATAALSGIRVQMVDATQSALESALMSVVQLYSGAQAEGGLTEEGLRSALGLISGSTDLSDLSQAELVVETIVDDFEAKAALLKELDRLCRSDAILVTGSHSSSVTRLASQTERPRLVVGAHFLPPIGAGGTVEVVRGFDTAPEAVATIVQMVAALGMNAVEVEDFSGFVADRLLFSAINEAASALMEGVATREAIDEAARAALGLRKGLLEMADQIGLDVCVERLRALQERSGNSAYGPSPLLVQMVEGGRLGRKSGRGFYEYGDRPTN
ncbi:MAG TPA: 3-hydroxyacyl-CoA dehydrogenase family protein [Chloroflexota bacterium]|nr:3-hydroxyacyl-CoA dehydrogenase family protein [Chloroflexota bacterium]